MKIANEKAMVQMAQVYKAFTKMSITVKEVDVYPLVIRESICSLINEPLEQRFTGILRNRKCTVKGYPYANECIGNSDLFPQSSQMIKL